MDSTVLLCVYRLFQLYGFAANSIYYYDGGVSEKGKKIIRLTVYHRFLMEFFFNFNFTDSPNMFITGLILYVHHFVHTWYGITAILRNADSSWRWYVHSGICMLDECGVWPLLYTRDEGKIFQRDFRIVEQMIRFLKIKNGWKEP